MTIERSSLKSALFFLVLCLCAVLAASTVDQYTATGEQLLLNPYFADGLEGWEVSGAKSASVEADSGAIRINLNDPGLSVQVSQQVAPGLLGDTVVLQGSVKSLGITGGTKAWEKGRIVLVQYVAGKAVYSTPHQLVAIDGTQDWAEYHAVIPILPDASGARVSLQLSHCSGELQVKELSLYRVQVSPVYSVVRLVILGVWALFMVCVFVPKVVGGFAGRKWAAPVVLVIVAILLGTTAPVSLKNEAASGIASHAKAFTNQLIDYSGTDVAGLAAELSRSKWLRIDITKVGHFLLFGLLGGLLYARQGRGAVWRTCIDIGMLACGSELIQLFIDGRSGMVGDVVIDVGGAGVGVLVIFGVRKVLGKRE